MSLVRISIGQSVLVWALACLAGSVTADQPLTTTPTIPSIATLDAARSAAATPANLGYYRSPALRGDTVVFVSEGDLWRVGTAGGRASRLTTHAGAEDLPAISPDGQTLAFTATYEGPREVYTMPTSGGLPTRRTFDGIRRISFVGWAPDGHLLYTTEAGTTLPQTRMWRHNTATNARELLPLAQCAEGALSPDGRTLVFTRLAFQGSHTDRYMGGTAQQLWRFDLSASAEATGVTTDYAGTSRRPLWWASEQGDRVVFTTDRTGVLNLWSMKPDGTDLRQHTRHDALKVGSASIDGARVVYQHGADLRLIDLATGEDKALAITLDSDMDQTRQRWVKRPATYITSAALNHDGSRLALTARGRVFNVPVKDGDGGGRLIDVDPRDSIRYREAVFMPGAQRLLALSDESGETELTTLPALGTGVEGAAGPTRLTTDAQVLRWRAVPSPSGKRIAHTDKHLRLFSTDLNEDGTGGATTLVAQNQVDSIVDFTWSPDSRYLSYVAPAPNQYRRIHVWDSQTGQTLTATTDRYDSYAPEWSADGKWLFFLSDRTFVSVTTSPWGPRAPEPFLDKPTKLYALALQPGTPWPFRKPDELELAAEKAKSEKKDEKKDSDKPEDKKDEAKDDKKDGVKVEIAADGLAERLYELPIDSGNYGSLQAGEKALFWLSYDADAAATRGDGPPPGATLQALKIGHDKPEAVDVAEGVASFALSADRQKMLIAKGTMQGGEPASDYFVVDANAAKADLSEAKVDLSGWSLSVTPRDEWRHMLIEAWRLLRDYFYDRQMHGVAWRPVLDKYLPLVERVRSRDELSDILTQMTGELSALHHFVVGGDTRRGEDRVALATLGADVSRTDAGWRIDRVLLADPDEPATRSPLRAPGVNVQDGDVVTHVNGQRAAGATHLHELLRAQAGQRVRLTVLPAGAAPARDVIVQPIDLGADSELRYRSWEVAKRKAVDELGAGQIGYVHLRAMGGEDFASFARDYYPIFQRQGLIIDVRDNNGGNIDSWILSRLLRKAWMYWKQPVGHTENWNMQYAFRGHMVVLCNESTASDGEALTEGFRKLGLGKAIGTRTWGGGIWLSFSNYLVDKGIASAGEYGSYGPDGQWLVEGIGALPDIVVDNPPHAAFKGEDAQLKAAVEHLQALIRDKPVTSPPVPAPTNKALPAR